MSTQTSTLRDLSETILPAVVAERIARKAGYRLAFDPETGATVICHRMTNARFTGAKAWAKAAAAVICDAEG